MKATRELGEVRMTVCRSRLASDRGEMERARFLVNLTALRGGGKSGAGAGNRGDSMVNGACLHTPNPWVLILNNKKNDT